MQVELLRRLSPVNPVRPLPLLSLRPRRLASSVQSVKFRYADDFGVSPSLSQLPQPQTSLQLQKTPNSELTALRSRHSPILGLQSSFMLGLTLV